MNYLMDVSKESRQQTAYQVGSRLSRVPPKESDQSQEGNVRASLRFHARRISAFPENNDYTHGKLLLSTEKLQRMYDDDVCMPDRRNIKTNMIEKRAQMAMAKPKNGVFSQEVMMHATAPNNFGVKRGSYEGSFEAQHGEYSISHKQDSCHDPVSLMARQRDLDQMKKDLKVVTEDKICAIDLGLHGNTDNERHNEELQAYQQACKAEIGHQEYLNKMHLVKGRNSLMPTARSSKQAYSTGPKPF